MHYSLLKYIVIGTRKDLRKEVTRFIELLRCSMGIHVVVLAGYATDDRVKTTM